MIQQELNVCLRTEMGKKSIAKNLRNDGYVPAVCYGALKEAVAVYVSAKELKNALSTEAKEHVLLNLKSDKDSEVNSKIAILKDLTRHPIKRDYIHADFQVLDMSKTIKLSVDVRLTGKAVGIKLGGVLDQVRRTVEIECLPSIIPSHIDIDISGLDINESVHVSDIAVPEGVEILTSGKLTIANLSAPIVVEEAEEAEEGAEEEEAEAAETAEESE
jgi:large subunit ribosomal protein L25